MMVVHSNNSIIIPLYYCCGLKKIYLMTGRFMSVCLRKIHIYSVCEECPSTSLLMRGQWLSVGPDKLAELVWGWCQLMQRLYVSSSSYGPHDSFLWTISHSWYPTVQIVYSGTDIFISSPSTPLIECVSFTDWCWKEVSDTLSTERHRHRHVTDT